MLGVPLSRNKLVGRAYEGTSMGCALGSSSKAWSRRWDGGQGYHLHSTFMLIFPGPPVPPHAGCVLLIT